MDSQGPSQKLLELRQQINLHNYRYHVLDSPIISDYEFDQLIVQLRRSKPTTRNGSPLIHLPSAPRCRARKVHQSQTPCADIKPGKRLQCRRCARLV